MSRVTGSSSTSENVAVNRVMVNWDARAGVSDVMNTSGDTMS